MRSHSVGALARAHRLHLSVARVQRLDRPAADDGVAVHHRPERDLGFAETVEIESMLAFQGRDGPHLEISGPERSSTAIFTALAFLEGLR
jgi:hypothetical protein